jgi:hypothetical protein
MLENQPSQLFTELSLSQEESLSGGFPSIKSLYQQAKNLVTENVKTIASAAITVGEIIYKNLPKCTDDCDKRPGQF